ncbi:MAG: hypothetical protein KBC73_05520 [Burkholderiaceae bacterium]|nr:hypothetical protein [Burkholderiaceae bacterium]
MEILRFTIAAGETKRFERAGRYIELLEVPTTIDIALTGANGERGRGMRGAEAGMYASGAFSGFEVANPTAAAQPLVIMITDGSGGSRKLPGLIDAAIDTAALSLRGTRYVGYVQGWDNQMGTLIDSTGGAFAVHQIMLDVRGTGEVRLQIGNGDGSCTAEAPLPAYPTTFQNAYLLASADLAYARKRWVNANSGSGGLAAGQQIARLSQGVWKPIAPLIVSGAAKLLVYVNGASTSFAGFAEIEALG